MSESTKVHRVALDELSFIGTVATLRHWTPPLALALFVSRLARRELPRDIAADLVPRRPDRSEPRAVDRRPKSYQLLSKPSHEKVVSLFINQK